MCIKDNYNDILNSNNGQEISDFMDVNCGVDGENPCHNHHIVYDNLEWLDGRLVELEEARTVLVDFSLPF